MANLKVVSYYKFRYVQMLVFKKRKDCIFFIHFVHAISWMFLISLLTRILHPELSQWSQHLSLSWNKEIV